MINMHFVMQASFWSSCSKAPWNDDASNSEKQYVEFIDKSKRNQSICLKIYSTCTLNTTVPILYIYCIPSQWTTIQPFWGTLGDTGTLKQEQVEFVWETQTPCGHWDPTSSGVRGCSPDFGLGRFRGFSNKKPLGTMRFSGPGGFGKFHRVVPFFCSTERIGICCTENAGCLCFLFACGPGPLSRFAHEMSTTRLLSALICSALLCFKTSCHITCLNWMSKP